MTATPNGDAMMHIEDIILWMHRFRREYAPAQMRLFWWSIANAALAKAREAKLEEQSGNKP